ncbi:DUF4309 domain-containing protein [Sporosarcina oncorhynchi]|uniref:DUF4309 domain-containing protein n=1 Tax=Sporosarcina oncorhynchi TaxID=3056444 RepID=A0ABZ0L4J3_9BACL|nr:DUF4309 domain-containing protein [Sporosarcina sp. T2O-4]WOV87516.1 DUF4309 domain-containing protein [Sporosarcina sp. T2O-4]
MNKCKLLVTVAAALLLAACSDTKDELEKTDSKINTSTEEPQSENPSDDVEIDENSQGESSPVAQEQKQMALDTLNGLADSAVNGEVYRLANGIRVGHSTRKEITKKIGEPEEQDEFDHYHGSMGNASYDLAYDEKGILKEARYFGTNVERQTNLGGITEEDLTEQLGQPDELRLIPETEEQNYSYRFGDFELQIIMGTDGKADHVNLKKHS